ncbi:MAG: HEAT repeat domain-containing protein [Candidatus Zixiibacteriota bacterium]|nr:MAG: HEAT repeat domain-containing protein [candidate division Zixibacteria bacterium]
MKKYLQSIIDIRKGEVAVTLLLFANIYLLLLTYYLLKPASRSLFLAKVGPDQLPFVFIVIAFVIVPVTTLYSRASRGLRLNHLITVTMTIIVICLFALRWLMTLPHFWVPYVYYTFASIYGVLSTSQFWLLANAVLNAAQAKRLFALLGLGAIFGAWTGGEVTSIIVKTFNIATEDLVYFSAGIIVLSMAATWAVWSMRKAEIEEPAPAQARKAVKRETIGDMFGSIKRSRHLLLIVGIMTMTMMVAALVEWQFQTVSTFHFTDLANGEVDKSALTSFLGKFYGRLSLVSILLQIVFAYRFLRVLGVGGVILFLPLGLLLGSTALIFNVSLLTAVLLRGADGSLKYSIDKTGRELLYLPVPLELKKKTKVFIDMFIDRWARGATGVLLILLMAAFGYDSDPMEAVRRMGFVVLVFLAVWIVFALKMRREYVNTFRKAVEKREIDLSEVRVRLNESATIATLVNSLKSENDREIEYALGLLAGLQNPNLVEPLKPLLNHRSADIRRKAIHVLMAQADKTLVPEVEKLMDDDNVEVRRDAMYFMSKLADSDRKQMLKEFLAHPEPKYRCAAVSSIAVYGSPDERRMIDENSLESLVNLPGEEGVIARRQVAGALGYLGDAGFNKYIRRVLDEPDPGVVSNTIWSIGRLRVRELVPWLLNALADSRYRPDARAALASYGSSVLGTLLDYLMDDRTASAIRRNIPRVMSQIPVQESVDGLTASISKVDPYLKYYVVKALNRLRNEHPDLKIDAVKVDDALIYETKSYYRSVQLIRAHGTEPSDGSRLLLRALQEKQDQNLERIFRILGLTYPPSDIHSAYLGIVSTKRTQRASAVEFLDNLLKSNIKRYLFPILDESSAERVVRKGEELFGIRVTTREEALEGIIKGRDAWLKVCAIYCCKGGMTERLRAAIESAVGDGDPVVRETAELVLKS